jgi:hypothetical protein
MSAEVLRGKLIGVGKGGKSVVGNRRRCLRRRHYVGIKALLNSIAFLFEGHVSVDYISILFGTLRVCLSQGDCTAWSHLRN